MPKSKLSQAPGIRVSSSLIVATVCLVAGVGLYVWQGSDSPGAKPRLTKEPKPNASSTEVEEPLVVFDRSFEDAGEIPTTPAQAHADFLRAFTNGYVFKDGDKRIPVKQEHICDLVLTSGKIVATDPLFIFDDCEALERPVPPGTYPVFLSVATRYGYPSVACALIRFKQGTPAKWLMATTATQKLSDLRFGEMFGMGVDSGTAGFFDHQFSKVVAKEETSERALKILNKPKERRYWASVPLDTRTGANLVCCETGDGDGFYASYWGLDRDGEPLCLVSDFGILTRGLDGQIEFDDLVNKLGSVLDHPDLRAVELTVKLMRVREGADLIELQVSGPVDGSVEGKLLDAAGKVIDKTSNHGSSGGDDVTFSKLSASNEQLKGAKLQLTYYKGSEPLK